jgi:hypothetical protein
MRPLGFAVDLASAVVFASCVAGVLANESDSFWQRLERRLGINRLELSTRQIPYKLYGGPVGENIAYTVTSLQNYGGYPPPTATTSSGLSFPLLIVYMFV